MTTAPVDDDHDDDKIGTSSYAENLLLAFGGLQDDGDAITTSRLRSLVPIVQAILERERSQGLHVVEDASCGTPDGQWSPLPPPPPPEGRDVSTTTDRDQDVAAQNASLRRTLSRVLPEQEWATCHRILQHSSGTGKAQVTDGKRLLVMQYLLFHVQCCGSVEGRATVVVSGLRALCHVLIPYMLLSRTNGRNENNPEEADIAPPSEALSYALLDVVAHVLSTVGKNDDRDVSKGHETKIVQYWNAILQALVESPHPNASLLLLRILQLVTQQQSSLFGDSLNVSPTETVLKAYYDKLWNSIQAAAKEGYGYQSASQSTTSDKDTNLMTAGKDWQNEHPQLASLSKHLLLPYMNMIMTTTAAMTQNDNQRKNHKGGKVTSPTTSQLLHDPHRQHVLHLWNRLLEWLHNENALHVQTWNEQQQQQRDTSSTTLVQQQQRQQTVLLVATTVLCPILPHLFPADASPPDQVAGGATDTLWRLVFACLSQGRWSLRDPHTLSGCSTNNHGVASMLRRRALYLLDVMTSSGGGSAATTSSSSSSSSSSLQLWKDYVLCFETFEMEGERHIVDQVWPVVAKLIRHAAASLDHQPTFVPGVLTPVWMQLLMGQLISSEQTQVRKLGIFRLLQVMGRQITDADKEEARAVMEASIAAAKERAETGAEADAANHNGESNPTNEKPQSSKVAKRNKKKMQKQQKDKKSSSAAGSKNNKKGKKSLEDLPTLLLLQMLPANVFVWDVLVPAFDSLGGSSVGYNVHMDETDKSLTANSTPKRLHKEDMIPLFAVMIQNYIAIASDDASLALFWKGIWDFDRLLGHLSVKTIVLLYQSASLAVRQSTKTRTIPMTDEDFDSIHHAFSQLFKDKSVVLAYRKELLGYLSQMLASSSRLPTATSASPTMAWSPLRILSVMTLFLPKYFSLDSIDWSIEKEDTLVTLSKWIKQLQSQKPMQLDFVSSMGATLATAFVSGQLKASGLENSAVSVAWDPLEGYSTYEQDMSWAICLFCTLSVEGETSKSASALLWPAIHKGLSYTGAAVLGAIHPNADCVARALLLLDYGCQLRVLSGLGHGDLVVDPKTQQMMPPPPNIEKLLQSSADFMQWQIRQLLSVENSAVGAGGTRSRGTRRLASNYAGLIAQLKTLHLSYPSSQTLSSAMNELLKSSYGELVKEQEHPDTCDDVKTIMLMGLIYAALSSNADPGKEQYLHMCRLVTKVSLNGQSTHAPKAWKQSARSMLQYSKWGSCSFLLPLILDDMDGTGDEEREEIGQLVEELLHQGIDSVTMTPSDALRPLFDCIVMTSKQWAIAASKHSSLQGQISYVKTLGKTVKALLVLLEESSISVQSAYFLNEICALIFHPELMAEEYNRLQGDSTCDTPIRDTFRNLVSTAGTKRSHISRAVLCRVAVGWKRGMNAIPYRDDIVKLLVHKEDTNDESATNQSKDELPTEGVLRIPDNTNERSISRTFVLCFIEELPGPGRGLDPAVQNELLHYVILQLLESAKSEESTNPSAVMKGTPSYCIKMRAWQALVILSRFVTDDIADQVCQSVFASLSEPIHSQIRYFMEVFTIQCARKHSDLFGEAFVNDISRTDLSLQHVASLMIMGGKFILSHKNQLDYFAQDADKSRLKRVLASIIPWLSSTQGFSRGIAQILVFALIPRVLDDPKDLNAANPPESNDWYLKVTYDFLEKNKDMQRLRSKQTAFFSDDPTDSNAESGMDLKSIMSMAVDEADEVDAVHAINAIKECLRSTYEEAHEDNIPVWKQIDQWKAEQELLQDSEEDSDDDGNDGVNNATFQRKIIPLDSLNLTLEDLREQRLSNAAGMHKQPLIVCASLVDKIPNLGGLARTSEIFAAQSLIIPDKSVTKMDNFKSLSVGAGDWIDIEEVKEDDLLLWLLQKRSQGFWIVGLEQTSSSLPLQEIEMPMDKPTVLLLGKEKEGIPVRFLQAVDQCMEIPQFGMIRSLNVHVSGAIAIWEYTRQTRLGGK